MDGRTNSLNSLTALPTILIISAWYAPLTHPRPHRWTALAEYWTAQGYTVHVLTARQPGSVDSGIEQGVHVHRCGIDGLQSLYGLWRGAIPATDPRRQKQGILLRIFRGFYAFIWKRLYFPDDACLWYFPARQCAKKLLQTHHFDLIISVSLPFTGHLIGCYLKKRFPEIPWLADIGDPFSLQIKSLYNPFLYEGLARRLERKILEMADKSVVTTLRTKELYRQYGFPVKNMAIALPLLHPASVGPAIETRQSESMSPHRWLYAGAFYDGVRGPHALLALLKAVNQWMPVRLFVFGQYTPGVNAILAKNPFVTVGGLKSREALRRAYAQADCLINIGNAGGFQLPSKITELLASGKPVLHISPLESDAFTDAWAAAEGLCRLTIQNANDVEAAAEKWLHWWETQGVWFRPEDKVVKALIRPYLIDAIAKVYIDPVSHREPLSGVSG